VYLKMLDEVNGTLPPEHQIRELGFSLVRNRVLNLHRASFRNSALRRLLYFVWGANVLSGIAALGCFVRFAG
jgi:hypothetical protein